MSNNADDNEEWPVTDDIVEDLRGALRRESGGRFWQNYFRRAADEIERLRADRDRCSTYADEWQDDYRSLVALVHAWADADIAGADAPQPWDSDTVKKFTDAVMALRKAVGR